MLIEFGFFPALRVAPAHAWIFGLALTLPGICAGQTPGPTPPSQLIAPGSERQTPPHFAPKGAIERHFESMHPKPRPQINGAVPGAHLLDRAGLRAAAVAARTQQAAFSKAALGSSGAVLPGLQLRPTQPGGEIPTSVVTGDFNNDGIADYLIANGATNDLWLYLGKGDGTFQLPHIVPLSKGIAPVYVATASLRNNGTLDLVVAENDTSSIGVLLGNGDGTFGYETEYMLPEPPSALVIRDFNHDGKLDVAAVLVTDIEPTTQSVPYLALLRGDGTGNFAAPVITSNVGFYSTAWNLDGADVNGDGLPDLLITGPGLENSQIYLNNGDGTFSPGATVILNGPANLGLDGRLADVNEDGCPDAVVADINTNVWISLGDCKGNFATPTYIATGDSNASLRLADINGDGHLDIVTAAYPGLGENNGEGFGMTAGNTLNVAFGDGKGNFSVSRNYVGIGQSTSLATADFNGDGKTDIVTANNDTDTSSVYLNDGTGSFGFPQGVFAGIAGQGVTNAPATSLSFVDLNNDSKPDLFFLDIGYNGEYYTASLLNDGTGRFSAPLTTDTGISDTTNDLGDYRVASFRGAGHQDLVAIGTSTAFSSASSYILFMPGNGDGTFGKPVYAATPNAGGSMTTGDFNSDGKLDFVAVDGSGTMTLASFLGNGDGTFRAGATLNFTDPNETIARVYAYDFNHDGKLDVLVFTTTNGYWTNNSTVWEFDGNGDGTFQVPRQLFTDFQPLALGDVNGDHNPDIARYDFFWPTSTSQTFGPAKFTTYLGQPDGTFVEASSYAPYSGIPESVEPFSQDGDPLASSLLGDFNNDGKLEEVAFQHLTGSNMWAQILMGNGDGTFTPTYNIYPTYLYGYPVYAHDLDGDGYTDMVELDSGSSALHVIKGGPASALQITLNDEVVTNNASCGYVFPDIASSSARTVSFFSSIAGVQLPASVSLPAGATSVQFCYTLASNFNFRQVFDVSASLDGNTATAYASDAYTLDFSLSISPSTVPAIYAGQTSAPITVTLTAAAGVTSDVGLSCDGLPAGASCQFAASSLHVSPTASVSTTVTVVTTSALDQGLEQLSFNIVASDPNVTRREPVILPIAHLGVIGNNGVTIAILSPATITQQYTMEGIPPYTFSCSGLPSGSTCAFAGDQQAYPSESSITATFNMASGLVPGAYPVTVHFSSGAESTTQLITFTVADFTLQGPASNSASAVVGGGLQNVSVSATALGGNQILLSDTCALDSGGTCTGGTNVISTSPTTIGVSIYLPAGSTSGAHQLTVTGTYQPAGSPSSLSHSITIPFYFADFSGTLSSSAVSMGDSSSSTVNVILNATTGFDEAITLSCSGVTQVSCTFSPASAQLVAGTPTQVALTLTTTALARNRQPRRPFSTWSILALAVLFPFALGLSARRKIYPGLFTLIAGAILLLPLASCGKAAGSGGGGPMPSVYYVSVTATATGVNVSHSIGTVTVTVP